MGKELRRYGNWVLSVLVGIGVFLFWYVFYPHALSYQEQYQLFLWTGDYFLERMSLPGGLADWLGEFIVQFYYVEWLGALLLALLFVVLQRLTARLLPQKWWLLSVLPVILLCIGPAVWIYILVRVCQLGWKHLWLAGWFIAVQLIAYAWLLPQWPLQQVMTGLNYYRIPLHYPQLKGYDKEMYELIRQDYLVRNEQWDEIVKRAQQYQVKTPFSSVCVNLALSKKRQLADRMFDFYQSGDDALIMPRIRDLTSMLPSAEAFWHLGMVNSAQRYMFDTQESILNGLEDLGIQLRS